MAIIQTYAPTTAANEDIVAEFYGLLQQTVDDTPNGDVLIIMRDMNMETNLYVYQLKMLQHQKLHLHFQTPQVMEKQF